MKKDDSTEKVITSCLTLIICWAIGSWAFGYSLWSVLGKDVPWYADLLAGIVLRQYVLPAAILCWIARLCGVAVPFIN
jgi:hypothetical protein